MCICLLVLYCEALSRADKWMAAIKAPKCFNYSFIHKIKHSITHLLAFIRTFFEWKATTKLSLINQILCHVSHARNRMHLYCSVKQGRFRPTFQIKKQCFPTLSHDQHHVTCQLPSQNLCCELWPQYRIGPRADTTFWRARVWSRNII